jgi:hypothetical protein
VSWTDGDGLRLEDRLREIATEVITTAELQYREGRLRHHEWRIEAKAQLQKQIREEQAEAERKRREHEAALAQARVDRLLGGEAAALRRANDIRAYVDAVQSLPAADSSLDQGTLERWRLWALEQADSIDPVRARAFLAGIEPGSVEEPILRFAPH